MGRLIDANKLIDYFYYGENDKPIIDGIADRKIIDIIKNQPTAYDVEKVVTEIKRQSVCTDGYLTIGEDEAIDIVKAGGINE